MVQTATNLDGAYFGSSFPSVMLSWHENMMEMPPEVQLYEPQIKGFKIVGKRGSKYFNPQKFSCYQNMNSSHGNKKSGKKNNNKKCMNGNPNCSRVVNNLKNQINNRFSIQPKQ